MNGLLCRAFGALYTRRCAWILLLFLSAFTIIDIVELPTFHFSGFMKWALLICFDAFKATAILFIINIVAPRSHRLMWFAVALYGLVALINVIAYKFYGFGITRKLMVVVAQTTSGECAEFMQGLLRNLLSLLTDPWTLCVVAGCIAGIYAIRFMPRRIFFFTVVSLSVAGLVLYLTVCWPVNRGRTAYFMCLRIPAYMHQTYVSQKNLMAQYRLRTPFPDADKAVCTRGDVNVIVVLGESASRAHHSLYGYRLDTSPAMTGITDSLYVFTDALSPSMLTEPNLEHILTFRPDYADDGEWYEYPAIFDLFGAAGYSTYWLSNQEHARVSGYTADVLTAAAHHKTFLRENAADALVDPYDEALLPAFRNYMADGNHPKMLWVHLHGSHTWYRNRYPAGRQVFTGRDVMRAYPRKKLTADEADIVADYDNTIRYTDSLLGVMRREVAAMSTPAVMIYFSDHGENVYDEDGLNGRDVRFARIPFIAYANKAFRDKYPADATAIDRACHRPFSTADVVYMIMRLTGIKHPLYDSTRDVTSALYTAHTRYVDGIPWNENH
ncbi:MAG: phosphoethanolamine transferase [Bacteroidales bacterium]|nr:phosphoethanolamine transferase [Bacteroidales bacterium]